MKNYLITSKMLRWIVAGAFGVMLIFNIMVSLEFEKDKLLPSLTLIELGNRAYAQGEGGGGNNCPGGSCTHTHYFNGQIQWECSACCPFGKSPRCDTGGCQCF